MISMNALNSQKGNKYTSKKLQFFIENEYLYISTSKNLKVVAMRALFEDPIEAEKFQGYCDDCADCVDCTDILQSEFPIDNDLVDVLIQLTVEEVVILFSQNIEDSRNNTRDTLTNQTK